MSKRTCTSDGCTRPHWARGFCSSHYSKWHREVHGRNDATYTRTCLVCSTTWETRRSDAKFCTDECKGRHYSEKMRTRSTLPADHPVRLLIAAEREVREQAREQARAEQRRAKLLSWRTPRECPGCACWFTPLYAPNAVTCSKRCARRVHRWRRNAAERNATGTFTWSEFMRIARKFGYCCAYCGEKPERLDPDHVIPLSRGGSNNPTNLLPSCPTCNSHKNAMTLPEWAAWIEERGLPPRRTTWAPGDPRYTHLTEAQLDACRVA